MAEVEPAPMNVPEWTLGDRLRKARETAGLNQADIAEGLELGRSTVADWENGLRRPKRVWLRAWSELTGVPLWWLLGEDPPTPPPTKWLTTLRGEPLTSFQPEPIGLLEAA